MRTVWHAVQTNISNGWAYGNITMWHHPLPCLKYPSQHPGSTTLPFETDAGDGTIVYLMQLLHTHTNVSGFTRGSRVGLNIQSPFCVTRCGIDCPKLNAVKVEGPGWG
jgi:hypothetical protein